MTAITTFLSGDHERLDALLLRSLASPGVIDPAPYEEFRAGLLRHIAMEEKVLLPDARRRAGQPLAIAKRLRVDHAALAALLVPTPTHDIVETLAALLAEHNPLEEGADGVYARCDELAGSEADDLVARLRAVPAVRVAAHVDGARVRAHIARLLRARH